MYDSLGITHSYTIELRPADSDSSNNNGRGFLLSACEIIPTGKEMMAALKAITPILANGNSAAENKHGNLEVKFKPVHGEGRKKSAKETNRHG